jgi:hypothetical protein
MKRALRGFIAVPLILAGLVTATTAGAQRPHDPVPLPDPHPVVLPSVDYCKGFTAVVTYTKLNQYIIHETTLDGVTTLKITGHAQATVTNQSTGESVTYNISGPGTVVLYPDGAFSIDAHGPNLLWTALANSYPGVPQISYTTGHVTLFVNAAGNTTSYQLQGRQTDVCEVLAS